MVEGPIVGIVIPAFRCEKFIGSTIQSVIDQTYSRWECIVVDDGSPDQTFAIATALENADGRVRVIRQENAGVAAARNRGLGLLSPSVQFVTCMDADDVYVPHAVQRLVDELERTPESIAVHGLADFIDENGDPMKPGEFARLGRRRLTCAGGCISRVPLDEPTTFSNVVTESTMFPPGLMLVRRKAFRELGGYDVDMVGAEDWDFLIRLCRLGSVSFIDEVLIGYRRHSSNQGAGGRVPEMCRRVYHKAFFSAENTEDQRRIVRESWRAKQRELIRIRANESIKMAKNGRVDKALTSAARIPIIAFRYIRGYPTLGFF
jgi:glycosyltransferase involved in cell wall biosynthesis